jgi:hypothetical protein
MKYVLSLFAVLLMIGTAHADGLYLMGAASTNDFEMSLNDTGYSGEVGWINDTSFGAVSLGGEVSNTVIEGDSTMAGAVNARVFFGSTLRPYLMAGAGATFEGDPLAQVGAGVVWVANEDESGSFGIMAGYEHRFYLDSDFSTTSEDGYAKVGLLLTF